MSNNPSRNGSGKRKRRREPDRDRNEPAHRAPPPSSSSSSSSLFLTPSDPGFDEHVEKHYEGFVHRSVDQLQPDDFHQQARAALERLRDANYYQYDIVMAGGKHSSRTFVKRTLVGNPGITYKYLGLRLFAHAWSGQGVSPLLKSIGDMNHRMVRMTEGLPNHQKCGYNLTLINYMEPTIKTRVGFKEESNYGMGKVSVSWHADSSLEPGSSIGVYHCLPTQRSARWDWRIALRPSPDVAPKNHPEGAAKPVVVDTKDGDAYFLLGNFNETHQHCVLAGSQSNRISSTHRVAVTKEDTYDYILKRVKIARKRFRLQLEATSGGAAAARKNATPPDAKVVRYCQRVLTEVETEWIAQYWLQGAQHDTMHVWWQRPMKTLEAYWRALESATWKLCHHLLSSPPRTDDDKNDETTKKHRDDVVRVLINEFKKRQSLRQQWDERRADKVYQRRIAEEYRPVARPVFAGEGADETTPRDDEEPEQRLPKDLAPVIRDLQKLLGKKADGSSPAKPEKDDGLRPKPNPNESDATATAAVGTNDTENTKAVGNDVGNANGSSETGSRPKKKKKKRKPKKKRK